MITEWAYEAFPNFEEFKNFLEGIDPYIRDSFGIGVAINVSSSIEKIFPLITLLDFVQVMGIERIGFQGEGFSDRSLEYIKILREKYPDLVISVDGGVNLETGKMAIEAGATRLVAGSAIFSADDIIGAIDDFQNL